MLIKAGVDISRLNRQIRRILVIFEDLYSSFDSELVITSTYEGTHSAGSLHYSNDAFDCRYPVIISTIPDETILNSIPDAFDVALETNHIHVEYDPK